MTVEYLSIPHLTTIELTRLFSKIEISKQNFYNQIPCWNWTGHVNRYGYGMYKIGRIAPMPQMIHRILYAYTVERIPKGEKILQIDHLCRNRRCCNPAHLELVTSRVNMLRGNSPNCIAAREKRCFNGHKIEGDNLHVLCNGREVRKMCQKGREKKANQTEKAKAAKAAWIANNPEKRKQTSREYMRRLRAKRKLLKSQ